MAAFCAAHSHRRHACIHKGVENPKRNGEVFFVLPWFQGLAFFVQKSREFSSVRTSLIFNHY